MNHAFSGPRTDARSTRPNGTPRALDRPSAAGDPASTTGVDDAAVSTPALRPPRWPIVIGVIAGLLIAAAGMAYALVRPPTWTAEASVVIVPDVADRSEQASLYDSLSHGQIPATAAEIYRQQIWHVDTPRVVVDAGVIPPSAVLQVTASGTDRTQVQRTLTEVLDRATVEVDQVITPYDAVVLTPDAPQAKQTGLTLGAWAGISVLAGLFGGVAGAAFLFAMHHRLTGAGRVRTSPAEPERP